MISADFEERTLCIYSNGIAISNGLDTSSSKPSFKHLFTKITTKTGVSLCDQYDTWKDSKVLQPPLKTAPIKARNFKAASCPVLKRFLCAKDFDVTDLNCNPWACSPFDKKGNPVTVARPSPSTASGNAEPSKITGQPSGQIFEGQNAGQNLAQTLASDLNSGKVAGRTVSGGQSYGQVSSRALGQHPGQSLTTDDDMLGQSFASLMVAQNPSPASPPQVPPQPNLENIQALTIPIIDPEPMRADACDPKLRAPSFLNSINIIPPTYYGNLKSDDRLGNDDLLEFYKQVFQNKMSGRDSRQAQVSKQVSSSSAYKFPYLARISFLSETCFWDKRDKRENNVFSPHSYNWYEYKRCTGVILNKNYVLTSSHCGALIEKHLMEEESEREYLSKNRNVRRKRNKNNKKAIDLANIFVYFGDFDYEEASGNSRRQRREINSVAIDWMWHPDDKLNRQSFALIELKGAVEFQQDSSFRPLWLPKKGRQVTFVNDSQVRAEGEQTDDRAFFLSWGNENGDKLNWFSHLKQLKMKFIPPTHPDCIDSMREGHFYPDESTHYICAKFSLDGNTDRLAIATLKSMCQGGGSLPLKNYPDGSSPTPVSLSFGTSIGGPLICAGQDGHEHLCALLATNPSKSFSSEQMCRELIFSKAFVFVDLSADTWQSRLQSFMTTTAAGANYNKQKLSFQNDDDPVLRNILNSKDRAFDKVWGDIGEVL